MHRFCLLFIFAGHTVIILTWLIHESSSLDLHPDRTTASSFDFLPLSQLRQRRRKDVLKTSYFWSKRRFILVSNGSRDYLFLRRRKDVFQETS